MNLQCSFDDAHNNVAGEQVTCHMSLCASLVHPDRSQPHPSRRRVEGRCVSCSNGVAAGFFHPSKSSRSWMEAFRTHHQYQTVILIHHALGAFFSTTHTPS